MLDVAALAAYIVFKENTANPNAQGTDLRRKFLKTLCINLCMPSIKKKRRQDKKNYIKPSVKPAIGFYCYSEATELLRYRRTAFLRLLPSHYKLLELAQFAKKRIRYDVRPDEHVISANKLRVLYILSN